MLWFKLLISFLLTYMVYNGFVLLGSDIRYVFKDLQDRTPRKNIFVPAFALLIFALLIFVVAYPLVLMITGSIPLNPLIGGLEIVIALIIRNQKISTIL